MELSIRFTENLTGSLRRRDSPSVAKSIVVTLRGHIPSLREFLRSRRIEVEGEMTADGLAKGATLEGQLSIDLFHGARLPYQWTFVGDDGQPYRFAGAKTLRVLEARESITDLAGEIFDAQGQSVASVELIMDSEHELGRFIRSVVVRARGQATPAVDSAATGHVEVAEIARTRPIEGLPGASQKLVVVTGAAGHLGLTLTRHLLQRGYRVRASVRDVRDRERLRPLTELAVEIVEGDVLDPVALRRAFVDADAVFHTAGGFKLWSEDIERDIFEPTVQGTCNVVAAAAHAGAKKIILTSAGGAVGHNASGREAHEEHEWNEDPRSPYLVAKTRAERRAWELTDELGIKMVSLCPTAIIGPNFYRHTPVTQIFAEVVHGKMPAIPPFAHSWVDVRDCAHAHLLAYESTTASGRYIVSGAYRSWPLVAELIAQADPSVRAPWLVIPEPLTSVIPALDWVRHKLAGVPRMMPKSTLDELKGRDVRFSTEKIKRELGFQAMDFEQTVADTVRWIRAHFPSPANGRPAPERRMS